MKTKSISRVRAMVGRDERGSKSGDVEVFAVIDWLKGGPLASAHLTPREARTLARRLLEAADIAEDIR